MPEDVMIFQTKICGKPSWVFTSRDGTGFCTEFDRLITENWSSEYKQYKKIAFVLITGKYLCKVVAFDTRELD